MDRTDRLLMGPGPSDVYPEAALPAALEEVAGRMTEMGTWRLHCPGKGRCLDG
ncbi:MAG: hypothetical protein ACYCZM_04825 [Acidimicrobiales bacterium]